MKKLPLALMICALLLCGCAAIDPAPAEDPHASWPEDLSQAASPSTAPSPTPSPTPTPIPDDVLALMGLNEQVWIEKHYRPWMVGRLYIPSVGINVAMFINGDGVDTASMRQIVTDEADSAIFYSDGVGNIIADHNNQGFATLPNVREGDKAYIIAGDCIVSLEAELVCDGTNTGHGIIDEEGYWVSAEHDFVCYTCGEDWEHIKIVGFKELREDYFEMKVLDEEEVTLYKQEPKPDIYASETVDMFK